jgi:hypothetical protein
MSVPEVEPGRSQPKRCSNRWATWMLEAVILERPAAKSLREEAQDSEWAWRNVVSILGPSGYEPNTRTATPLLELAAPSGPTDARTA